MIADLSKVESLRVISRGTAMRFRGGERTAWNGFRSDVGLPPRP